MDGTNGSTTFIDSCPNPKTITPYGSPQIKTAVSKFGGSSVYLSSGNYLKVSAHPDLNVGTGDYTIDLNIYLTVVNSDNYFYDAFNTTNKNAIEYASGNLIYYAAGARLFYQACSIVANTWYHIEITRKSGIVYLFLNGALLASVTSTTDHSVYDDIVLGAYGGVKTTAPMNGYIDEFRIIKGNAENTVAFTPPTQAYNEPVNVLNNPISSLNDMSLGAFPPNNEWDTYIVNSTLNNKITAGNNNIWHWTTPSYGSYCRNTPSVDLNSNTYRTQRGANISNINMITGVSFTSTTYTNANCGFRPVLNYIESDIATDFIY
jgi:hypothetical protein